MNQIGPRCEICGHRGHADLDCPALRGGTPEVLASWEPEFTEPGRTPRTEATP